MDMGCGTAVLAVMAAKKGAVNIMAIDNDEWAYRNSLENVEANGFSEIQVKLGDAGDLPDYQYDVFIANINRNILLNDMHHYVKCMKNNGLLLLSGYYEEDAVHISDCAAKLNLKHERSLIRNRWTAEVYRLNT
jgi:ribosomal protein L11 methyltransferase